MWRADQLPLGGLGCECLANARLAGSSSAMPVMGAEQGESEAPTALVTHAVIVGVDSEGISLREDGSVAREALAADVLAAFPLAAIGTPLGDVPPLPDSVALFCLPAG